MIRSFFEDANGPAAASPLAVLASCCLAGLLATTFAPRASAELAAPANAAARNAAPGLPLAVPTSPFGPITSVRVAKTILDMQALPPDAFADWTHTLR